jgi:8-oxo-dGTP pyrophosphatase MutT (NUDIX family)
MHNLWRRVGRIAYWLSWPAIILYARTTNRTRLLVTCGDSVLLVKSWLGDGRWSLPGGGLHGGEPPLQAALRELKEETSIELAEADLQLLGAFRFHNHGISFPYTLYAATVPTQLSITAQAYEITDIAWLDHTTLPVTTLAPDVITALHAKWS